MINGIGVLHIFWLLNVNGVWGHIAPSAWRFGEFINKIMHFRHVSAAKNLRKLFIIFITFLYLNVAFYQLFCLNM